MEIKQLTLSRMDPILFNDLSIAEISATFIKNQLHCNSRTIEPAGTASFTLLRMHRLMENLSPFLDWMAILPMNYLALTDRSKCTSAQCTVNISFLNWNVFADIAWRVDDEAIAGRFNREQLQGPLTTPLPHYRSIDREIVSFCSTLLFCLQRYVARKGCAKVNQFSTVTTSRWLLSYHVI